MTDDIIQYWRTNSKMYYVFVGDDELATALRTMADLLEAKDLGEMVIDLGVTIDDDGFTVGALIEDHQ